MLQGVSHPGRTKSVLTQRAQAFAKVAVAATAAVAMALTIAPSALAAPANSTNTTATSPANGIDANKKLLMARSLELTEVARTLTPYVHRDVDGTFQLDAPVDVTSKLPSDAYAQIIKFVDLNNSDIRTGKLISTPSLTVEIPSKSGAFQPLGGRNDIETYWWGVAFYVDATVSARIQGALNIGAGTAALVSIIAAVLGIAPAAVPAGIISALLWIGAGVLALCTNENGAIIYDRVIDPILPFSCTGQ